jgi:hypothetical protein
MKTKWVWILVLILVLVILASSFRSKRRENFAQRKQNLSPNPYPFEAGGRLLNQFPSTGRKTVTDNQYNNVWYNYPSFRVDSFDQITNNIRYFMNPDIGNCVGAEFCGAMYKDTPKPRPCNYVYPLPPVSNQDRGIRINYYKTPNNLFLSDQPGPACPLPAF